MVGRSPSNPLSIRGTFSACNARVFAGINVPFHPMGLKFDMRITSIDTEPLFNFLHNLVLVISNSAPPNTLNIFMIHDIVVQEISITTIAVKQFLSR